MNELIYWAIFVPAFIVIFVLLLKYIDGDFTYTDTVIEKNKYTRTFANSFVAGGTSEQFYRIIIERRYLSGKIEFITKELVV